MPTATIQVAAVTSPDQWTLGAGADKVVAVNGPDDDDTSYISTSSPSRGEQYSIAAAAIPANSTINSVSVTSRVKKAGATTTKYFVRLYLGATYTGGTPQFLTTNYATWTEIFSRPGGGSWSQADLSSIQVHLNSMTGTAQRRCTSLWVIVDYTPPANPGQMFQLFP